MNKTKIGIKTKTKGNEKNKKLKKGGRHEFF